MLIVRRKAGLQLACVTAALVLCASCTPPPDDLKLSGPIYEDIECLGWNRPILSDRLELTNTGTQTLTEVRLKIRVLTTRGKEIKLSQMWGMWKPQEMKTVKVSDSIADAEKLIIDGDHSAGTIRLVLLRDRQTTKP